MLESFLVLGFIVLLSTLGITALVLWVGYRLVVSAVRQGVLEANAEQARLDQGQAPARWSVLAARPEQAGR